MPRINDIKIVRKNKIATSLTARGQNNDDIIKILKTDHLLNNLKLNNVASTNDYFEKRKTEYPFEGSRTQRNKESLIINPLSNSHLSSTISLKKPNLLKPIQIDSKNDISRFLLDSNFQKQQELKVWSTARIDAYTTLDEKQAKELKLQDIIQNQKIKIVTNKNQKSLSKIDKIKTGIPNLDVSYLKDQSGIQLMSQLTQDELKAKFKIQNQSILEKDRQKNLMISQVEKNKEKIANEKVQLYPNSKEDLQSWIKQQILAKDKLTLKEPDLLNKQTLQQILLEINNALQSPFKLQSETEVDQRQQLKGSKEFEQLDSSFIQEVVPNLFSDSLLKEFSQPFENKLSGSLFLDLFKKHNLEHLLKKDNLIFQILSQDKALKDARIDHFQNQISTLGQPVNRQDAITLLKWLDTMMNKLADLKTEQDLSWKQQPDLQYENLFKDLSKKSFDQNETENTIFRSELILTKESSQEEFEAVRLGIVLQLLQTGLKELIRQVSVSCIERGYALLKIFNAYQIIIKGMALKFEQAKKNFKIKYRQKVDRVMSAYQGKREEADQEIRKFNNDMTRIRTHYEELKISEEFLKKQLQETQQQLEVAKFNFEEQKDLNRKLYKEYKEARTQIHHMNNQYIHKNMKSVFDSFQVQQKPQNQKEAKESDLDAVIHRRKKKLKNKFDLLAVQEEEKQAINASPKEYTEENLQRVITDDDQSIISQLDINGKDKAQQSFEEQLIPVQGMYSFYQTADKATQVEEYVYKMETEQNQTLDLSLYHQNDRSTTKGVNQEVSKTKLNAFVKNKFEINDEMRIFASMSENQHTIQVTDQSEIIENQKILDYEDISQQQQQNELNLNYSQKNQFSKGIKSLNAIASSSINNDYNTLNRNENQSLEPKLNENFNKLNTSLNFNKFDREKNNILIQENQSNNSYQNAQQDFKFQDQPINKIRGDKRFQYDSNHLAYDQDYKSQFFGKQLAAEQQSQEMQNSQESILQQKDLSQQKRQLMSKMIQSNTNKKHFSRRKSSVLAKGLANQKYQSKQMNNKGQNQNDMLMMIEAFNYKSDEEVYQEKELNNQMFKDLAQDVIQSQKLDFRSFHEHSQDSLLIISDQNSFEMSTNKNLTARKRNLLNQRNSMNILDNLLDSSSKKGKLRQEQSFLLDKSNNGAKFKNMIEGIINRSSSHGNIQKMRAKYLSSTKIEEYKFNQRRKVSINKKHPAFAIYSKLQTKPIGKIRKVIPRKMVNKAISNIYSLKLETLLSSNEDNSDSPPPLLYEFIYEIFIKKYGLKHVADQKYSLFLSSVKKFQHDSYKIKGFAKFVGLSIESQPILDNQISQRENLIFYLGVLAFMNSLNVGNKIENQDSGDKTLVAFVKIFDSLKYIFDTQIITNDSLILLRKELEKFRISDTKFKNKNGIFDFDEMMLYLIPKWRSLTSDYQDSTIFDICSLLVPQEERSVGNQLCLNFEQFKLLARSFDYIPMQTVKDLFIKYTKGESVLQFDQLKQMISQRKILSINSFIRSQSIYVNFLYPITFQFDLKIAVREAENIKRRLSISNSLIQFQETVNLFDQEILKLQSDRNYSSQTCKNLLIILSKESKRLYTKYLMKQFFDHEFWRISKIKLQNDNQFLIELTDTSHIDISFEQNNTITPKIEKELNLSNL